MFLNRYDIEHSTTIRVSPILKPFSTLMLIGFEQAERIVYPCGGLIKFDTVFFNVLCFLQVVLGDFHNVSILFCYYRSKCKTIVKMGDPALRL